MLQIHNVFVNVSKGEVAKSGDLQKAFGKTDISDIVKEVRRLVSFIVLLSVYLPLDPQERRSSSRRERKGSRPCFPSKGDRHTSSRKMRRSSNAAPIPCRDDRKGYDRGGLQCQTEQKCEGPGMHLFLFTLWKLTSFLRSQNASSSSRVIPISQYKEHA